MILHVVLFMPTITKMLAQRTILKGPTLTNMYAFYEMDEAKSESGDTF